VVDGIQTYRKAVFAHILVESTRAWFTTSHKGGEVFAERNFSRPKRIAQELYDYISWQAGHETLDLAFFG
jgi:hypothetical protein